MESTISTNSLKRKIILLTKIKIKNNYLQLILTGSNNLLSALRNVEIKTNTNAALDLSYEIRTDLNTIKGFARMIYSGKLGDISDKEKKYIGYILEESNKFTQMHRD